MRLVVTVPWGRRLGGAEEMLLAALRSMDRERFSATVVFFEPGPFEHEVAELGIPTLVVETGRMRQVWGAAKAIRAVARILRVNDPDVILNWSPKTQLYGSPAAWLARMSGRVVWWQHGVPERHWMDRAATRLPAAAIGCSSKDSERAQLRLSPRRPTFVVHPGVEDRTLPREATARIRQEVSRSESAVVLGIVGRLQPWKGQHLFLRALAELRERGRNVCGLVVGGEAYGLSSGYARELHDLAGDLGLLGAVTFTGQVEDARPYVGAMDLLVNASDREPFGIVLLEGMALEVPVVAIASGGPAEIVEDGVTGMLVEHRNPGALADALDGLVASKDERERLGRAGRERLKRHFTAEAMTRSLEQELQSLSVTRSVRPRDCLESSTS